MALAVPLEPDVVVDAEVVPEPVVVPVADVAPEEAVVVEADVELEAVVLDPEVLVDADVVVVPPVDVDVEVEELVVVEGFLAMEPEAVAVLAVEVVVAVSADALDPSEEDPHPVMDKAHAAVTAKKRLRFIPEELIFNARTAMI